MSFVIPLVLGGALNVGLLMWRRRGVGVAVAPKLGGSISQAIKLAVDPWTFAINKITFDSGGATIITWARVGDKIYVWFNVTGEPNKAYSIYLHRKRVDGTVTPMPKKDFTMPSGMMATVSVDYTIELADYPSIDLYGYLSY